MTRPNFAALGIPQALGDYLRRLEEGGNAFDSSALVARIAALEGIRFVGLGGTTVVGSVGNGFVITSSTTGDPLAAQIFGS